jgi:oligopeptide/dipeptide ABC transporter ATP-binding protein
MTDTAPTLPAGETFEAPRVRRRLRNRPPHHIRRARGQLNGIVAVVGLILALLLAALVFLRQGGAITVALYLTPLIVIAALAIVAGRGFRDRRTWSFLLALGIGLVLTVTSLGLMGFIVSGIGGLSGNAAFAVFVAALILLALGLPLILNLVRGRSWFRAEEKGAPIMATAETVLAEAPGSAEVSGSLVPTSTVEAAPGEILLSVRGLKKHFPILGGVLRRQVGTVYAVDGVDFDVRAGEVFSLVGESGCGKTTLGRTVLQLTPPTEGSVVFDGYELGDVNDDDMRPLRRRMQIIFQDPFGSLNPRMPVSDIIGEGLLAQGVTDRKDRDKRVGDALEVVGLRRDYTRRYPHEFSGGQRQRIGIARALALNPDLIVCDEPVSALDVSIQSQVLNLLLDLKRDFNLTYLFISHNLSVVEYFSDRIGVMYLGKIVEIGTVEELYSDPRHPYTVALLSAIPDPDPRRRRKRLVLKGDVPSPAAPPSGCRFHTRCWLRERLDNPEICVTTEPELRALGGEHRSACHFAEEISESVVKETAAVTSVLETAAVE